MAAIFEYSEHTGYDRELAANDDNEILDYFKAMNRKLLDDIDSPEFVFDKFSAWYTAESNLDAFKSYIEDEFVCIQREGMFCEVVPKGYSKATGIEFLLKHYGIPLENSYAFGDSNNDLDMLSYVPNSVAMGVCTPEVEKVSTYKTDTVLGDGIYKAMKHFEII
jgi:hydroxymethylpyrimidine pyrophosphatase-like HAD family hydrolase